MAEMAIFNVQRAITPKACNPELRFMHPAHLLMVLNICMKFNKNILNGFEVHCAHRLILLNIYVKFHENISNGFQVTERTRFCDRQTDNGRHVQNQYASP